MDAGIQIVDIGQSNDICGVICRFRGHTCIAGIAKYQGFTRIQVTLLSFLVEADGILAISLANSEPQQAVFVHRRGNRRASIQNTVPAKIHQGVIPKGIVSAPGGYGRYLGRRGNRFHIGIGHHLQECKPIRQFILQLCQIQPLAAVIIDRNIIQYGAMSAVVIIVVIAGISGFGVGCVTAVNVVVHSVNALLEQNLTGFL